MADASDPTTISAVLAGAQQRAAAWEPDLGAVVAWTDPRAHGDPPPGPLAGLAVGIKDLMNVRGLVRRCAAPGLVDEHPAAEDAAAVRSLRDAGADIVATLSTHQFAYGIVTPQTTNPRAPARMAGGSSGGSAAAVAAGIVDAALGSDTGGSIRIPAACCGVVGFKPTYGLIPLDGVQPLSPSLDTVGPMAADVATTARLLAALIGTPAQVRPAEGPRVGVLAELAHIEVAADVATATDDAVGRLREAGAKVSTVSVPSFWDAPGAAAVLLGSEALAEHRQRLDRHANGWWPDVKDRLERARRLTPEDVQGARAAQSALGEQVAAVFEQVDVVVMPVLAVPVPPAAPVEVQVAGRTMPIAQGTTMLTNPWNLAGVPAGALPVGRDRGGAPIGVQVIGRQRDDHTVLAVMALLEQALGGPWPAATPP